MQCFVLVFVVQIRVSGLELLLRFLGFKSLGFSVPCGPAGFFSVV